MGLGDELMALGRAQRVFDETGRKVAILDRAGKPRWHPLWDGAPEVAAPEDIVAVGGLGDDLPFETIHDGGGCRPYIDYARTTAERWAFKGYRPCPARLAWLQPNEICAGHVVIEPTVKAQASPNKHWPDWQEMVDAAPHVPWLQIGPRGTSWLDGVTHLETKTFRDAVNALAGAAVAVLPEGGLHHAAAAVGTPAVVLYGAFILPRVTGYDGQTALAVEDADAVGWRVSNKACRKAWKQITPARVLTELERLA